MKKFTTFVKMLAIIIAGVFILSMTACKSFEGYDFIDTKYHFDRAIIRMPDDKIIEIEIEKWADSEGEQLTITGKDGKVYLVNSENCVLIKD